MAALIALLVLLAGVIAAGVWFGYQAGRADVLHDVDQLLIKPDE